MYKYNRKSENAFTLKRRPLLLTMGEIPLRTYSQRAKVETKRKRNVAEPEWPSGLQRRYSSFGKLPQPASLSYTTCNKGFGTRNKLVCLFYTTIWCQKWPNWSQDIRVTFSTSCEPIFVRWNTILATGLLVKVLKWTQNSRWLLCLGKSPWKIALGFGKMALGTSLGKALGNLWEFFPPKWILAV